MRDSSAPIVDVLTREEARALAVAAQRLDRRPPRPRGRAAIKALLLETIRALGCVQLDTISVVARSHETVLWSRVGPYDPTRLAELHYPDGHLFEYWAHAAALAPVADFPLYRRVMDDHRRRDEAPGTWAAEQAATLERVLATVRDEGPTASRRFERATGPRPEPWAWWGGKDDRRALDHLWSRGDLMVLRRVGFERVWDLTERVIPADLLLPRPSPEEERRGFVRRALAALGVATPRWICDYFRGGARGHVPLAQAAGELRSLAAEGEAVAVRVDGLAEPTWLDAALLPRLEALRRGQGRPARTTLLSPFDNLIWHRGRTEALWGFAYRLESYTPAAKRRYGYYTLPILHRGRLIGRVDPVLDRRARVLTVRTVHVEPGVRPAAGTAAAVAGALRELATFLGAEDIALLAADPPAWLPLLASALASPAG